MWIDLVEQFALSPERLGEDSPQYVDTKGLTRTFQRSVLIDHLFNHATHHRGQISAPRACASRNGLTLLHSGTARPTKKPSLESYRNTLLCAKRDIIVVWQVEWKQRQATALPLRSPATTARKRTCELNQLIMLSSRRPARAFLERAERDILLGR